MYIQALPIANLREDKASIMAQPLSFTIINQGDNAIFTFVDMNTGRSGNIAYWNKLDKEMQDLIMDIVENPDVTDGDPIQAIYDTASGYNSSVALQIRKELGVQVFSNKIIIDGISLPVEFQKLLGNVSTKEEALSIVAFAKDLNKNPGEHCKESLVEWLLTNPSLSFTPDGRIIGYRAVDENFLSSRSGYGIVNGQEIEDDNLDNTPGNNIKFPRFMVDQDPNSYCSVGLHVGTWKYAINYSDHFLPNLISVAFKASHVVSPPRDAHQEKIRVEEYDVLETVHSPYSETIVNKF